MLEPAIVRNGNFLAGITRPRKLLCGKQRALTKPLQRAEDLSLVLNKKWVEAQAAQAKPSRAEAQMFIPADFGCCILFYPRKSLEEHLERALQMLACVKRPLSRLGALLKPPSRWPQRAKEITPICRPEVRSRPIRLQPHFEDGRTWQRAGTRLKQQRRATPAALSQSDFGHAPGAPKSQTQREPQFKR